MLYLVWYGVPQKDKGIAILVAKQSGNCQFQKGKGEKEQQYDDHAVQ